MVRVKCDERTRRSAYFDFFLFRLSCESYSKLWSQLHISLKPRARSGGGETHLPEPRDLSPPLVVVEVGVGLLELFVRGL